MKKLLLMALVVGGFAVNAQALDMNDVNSAADKAKSAAIIAKEWATFKACMLASKLSGNQAESEKKCFTDLIDSKNTRIAELEAEVSSLKSKQQ
jgi:hypothetical protein